MPRASRGRTRPRSPGTHGAAFKPASEAALARYPRRGVQTGRLARAVEVRVEDGDVQALAAQRPRQGHRHRALAHPALARADRQPVAHSGQRLEGRALLRLHLGDDVRAAVADDVAVGLHLSRMIRDPPSGSTEDC